MIAKRSERTEPAIENVADYLPVMAARQPDTTAITFLKGGQVSAELSYRELDERSTHIALGLHAIGIEPGMRAALLVKPSPDLFLLTFALFKAGIAPVMVDPGIGTKNMKSCLERAAPQAFIGIPAAHVARLVLGWPKFSRLVTAGPRLFWGGSTLSQIEKLGAARAAEGGGLPTVSGDDDAAVLFTSGSTGPAKGVLYKHRMMVAQVESIRALFDIQPGEVDLPTFPLFALFDPALGMTTIIPEMDATQPAKAKPENILGPIERFGVTTMFGSPALLNTVGRAGAASGTKLKTLKRVIAAGAPLPAATAQRWLDMMPEDGNVFPPYGCTEALPISCIDARTIIESTWAKTETGAGVCVGHPVPGLEAIILTITDAPIRELLRDEHEAPRGEVGEICVRGPQVTEVYFREDEKTELAKIADGRNIWHRVGDLGWLDEDGRLWFCGRKSHRVIVGDKTLFTVPIEKVFDAHPQVFRTALVGPVRGDKVTPTLCVELEAGVEFDKVLPELIALRDKGAHWHADVSRVERFIAHPGFPVDIRHNAKINREQLKRWVEEHA